MSGAAAQDSAIHRGSAIHRDREADRRLAAVIARSPQVYGDRLNVKLREGSGAELIAGKLRSRTGVDLTAVAEVFAHGVAEPLFTALPWDGLDALHRRACAALPAGRGPGHLGLWFRLTTPTAGLAAHLSDRLWGLDLVEYVVHEGRGTPASLPGSVPVAGPSAVPLAAPLPNDIPPPTPLFTSLQQLHEPSPLGYGIWRSQGFWERVGKPVAV